MTQTLLEHFVLVLIPYQQGGLFRRREVGEGDWKMERLNPLSAGRSFQTDEMGRDITIVEVLIPYQQGGLFRQ